MIEKFITNELSLKRWRRFKRKRTSMFAVWVFAIVTFFGVTAELWSNSSPLYLKYQGQTYFPFMKTYHPSVFGIEDQVVMDYRKLQLGSEDSILWQFNRWDPFERNAELDVLPGKPSSSNWFGTDDSGRDVFARLLYGLRYSLSYAFLVWAICSVIGIFIGAIMGYAGGWIDLLGQRLIEVIESLPWLLLLMTILTIFNAGLGLLVLFSAFLGWVGVSMYVRAEFLKLRKREFVEAARALGAGRHTIIFKHILPNALSPWITMTPFMISGSVAGLAALDYLGLGLRAPTPSWGELLLQAKQHFQHSWWLAVYPSLALFITLVLLNLIGEGVRDAYDPRK